MNHPVFDDELNLGVVLTTNEVAWLSDKLSKIYLELIEKLAIQLARETNTPLIALHVVCRRAIVPIAHCFFERLLRINKAFIKSSGQLAVRHCDSFSTPQVIEELDSTWVQTPAFNQSVVSFLGEIWGLKKTMGEGQSDRPIGLQAGFKNNLHRIRKSRLSLPKFFQILELCTRRLSPMDRFPVLTFANAESALRTRQFYLWNFKRVNDAWHMADVEINPVLRNRLFNDDLALTPGLISFWKGLDFSELQIKIAKNLFNQFLVKLYPVQFLEAFLINYEKARASLAPFRTRALLSSGDGDTRSTFVIAAAKAMGFRIVKAQHGGHYGYYKDFSQAFEIEWPATDEFLTWGWTRKPNHPASTQLYTRPLPSPWLSERKKYWKNLRINRDAPFDILWMPQMMKRFTAAPQGASSIRRDVIEEFSKYMVDLISSTTKSKVRVYCKPYNPTTIHLMAKIFEQLQRIGRNYYECSDRFDKGLTYHLVEKANLVLWDQPGTGFLECVSCRIPTMLLWSRLYCEEEDWCIHDFQQLEDVGIIHRTSESLLREYCNFKNSPHAWMNESRRHPAVENFVKKFALVDDKWWKSWRLYLAQLKGEVQYESIVEARANV